MDISENISSAENSLLFIPGIKKVYSYLINITGLSIVGYSYSNPTFKFEPLNASFILPPETSEYTPHH
jgi:hypothetical protein